MYIVAGTCKGERGPPGIKGQKGEPSYFSPWRYTASPTTARPTTARPTTARPTTAHPTTARPTTERPIIPRNPCFLAGYDCRF